MANFITTTELTTAIGTDAYNGITYDVTVAQATIAQQLLDLADAEVLSALRRSGYASLGVTYSGCTTADTNVIKSMAIRVALRLGCARRGFAVPETLSAWVLPSDFYTAKIRLPDLPPDFDGAPGAIIISDSGTESDPNTSRGTIFGLDKTGGYP